MKSFLLSIFALFSIFTLYLLSIFLFSKKGDAMARDLLSKDLHKSLQSFKMRLFPPKKETITNQSSTNQKPIVHSFNTNSKQKAVLRIVKKQSFQKQPSKKQATKKQKAAARRILNESLLNLTRALQSIKPKIKKTIITKQKKHNKKVSVAKKPQLVKKAIGQLSHMLTSVFPGKKIGGRWLVTAPFSYGYETADPESAKIALFLRGTIITTASASKTKAFLPFKTTLTNGFINRNSLEYFPSQKEAERYLLQAAIPGYRSAYHCIKAAIRSGWRRSGFMLSRTVLKNLDLVFVHEKRRIIINKLDIRNFPSGSNIRKNPYGKHFTLGHLYTYLRGIHYPRRYNSRGKTNLSYPAAGSIQLVVEKRGGRWFCSRILIKKFFFNPY